MTLYLFVCRITLQTNKGETEMSKFKARKWTEQVQISKPWDVAFLNRWTNEQHYYPDMCFSTKAEADKVAAEFEAAKAYDTAKQWPIDGSVTKQKPVLVI